jgi:hypothetical protein
MKCIRNSNGQVQRVKDETAHSLVTQGKAEYVPKTVWKTEVRDK